ncbi:HAD family hydrolase [Desulfospira joergensenii]|uniref:HAD family hydrolase n=1 Tax=Desulfospira joergensenii TaxID=53329 RepID=UPI0003B504F5|nr:HAD family hydrolase [Desulfospira joergensenii]
MKIHIPGTGELNIENLLMDYNGTLAVDGRIMDGVKEKINELASRVNIHVITADTFGSVEKTLKDTDCTVFVLPRENQDLGKLEYLKNLGPEKTVCVGNGANDCLMLKESVLGIAVLLEEGLTVSALTASDILVKDILDVFSYLEKPDRLKACLRT